MGPFSVPLKLGRFTQSIHHWEEKNGERWPGQPGSRLYMEPYRMAEESHIHVLSIEVSTLPL